MEKTSSFLAFESLIDLSKKLSILKKREYEENDKFCFYRNFTYLSWYSRLNINSMRIKDQKALERISVLCSEPASPKYLSFAKEDVYDNIYEDLENLGFILAKPQKGMLFYIEGDIECEKDENIISISKKNINEWLDACDRGFGRSTVSSELELFLNDKNCHIYGYTQNGKIVSTALLNIAGKNGGIHEVATIDEYRKNGYATALVKQIMSDAKNYGCDILSLQASIYGEPVYKKLGFKEVSNIVNYKKNL